MRRVALLLTVLLPVAGSFAAGTAVEDDLRGLSSPFEEVRLAAVSRLARTGPEVREPLLRLYADADFRTKSLVLDVFAARADPTGLTLVYGDLGTDDLGVRSAQRGLLSALFGDVRDLVARELAPLLREDWRREEAVRVLPTHNPFARKVLADLARSTDEDLKGPAIEVSARVEVLDGAREKLAKVETDGAQKERGRARALLLHLARHDVERALLAVSEAGSEGYYDGMYVRLAEVVSESCRPREYLKVLAHIIRDEAWPEPGVSVARKATYAYLEPVPRDLGRYGVRQVAAQALGDAGEEDPELAATLGEWLRESNPDYTELDGFAYTLALSLAALGEMDPIQVAITEFRDRLEGRRPGFRFGYEWERLTTRLAGCYGRLGRHREAADVYRNYLRAAGQRDPVIRYNLACALAKAGHPEAALGELALAVADGYGKDPSQITWLERDGDLASLRDMPGYARLLREAKRR